MSKPDAAAEKSTPPETADERAARVGRIRARIAQGDYEIDAEKLADSLLKAGVLGPR